MAILATPSRRRLVMAVLLCLAAAGAVIRYRAPDPSTLRDVGTLLMVLWLPAVGNLVAWLIGRLPRRAPRVTDFPAGAAFAPHLQVDVEGNGLPADLLQAIDPSDRRCTLIVGRRGFTARLAQSVAQTLAHAGRQTVWLELLHPAVALPELRTGTVFHLLVATTAVAKGRVLALPPA